jgi:hypothetical protein
MRALLLLALSLVLLTLVYLISRSGVDERRGLEPAAPEVEEAEDLEGVASREHPRRIEAADTGSDGESDGASTPPGSRGPGTEAAGGSATRLVVRMLTPEGMPLAEALRELRRGRGMRGPGEMQLSAVVSTEAPDVGSSIPYLPFREEGSPYLETHTTSNAGSLPGTVRTLHFDTLRPSVFVSALVNRRVAEVRHVRRDIGEVTFIISTMGALEGHASFQVCFVDGAGSPVEGVELASHARGSQDARGRSDLHGCAEVGPLEPGTYGYEASCDGFGSIRLSFSLKPAQQLDLGQIVLKEPIAIRGRLIGPEDEIRGREVILREVPGSAERTTEGHEWRMMADSDGRFALEDLEPGAYALCVSTFVRFRPGRRIGPSMSLLSPFIHVDASQGSVVDVVVELEPKHTVIIHTHLPDGEDVELRILDAGGLVMTRTTLCPDECEFHAHLPSGTYRLEARRGEWTETIEFDSLDGVELDVGH